MGPDILTLSIHRMMFLGTGEKMLLREIISDEGQLARLSGADIARITGHRLKAGTWKPGETLRGAEHDAELLQHGDMKCVSLLEAAYPPQLAEIYDPPYLLYYRGSFPENTRPALAVVGTRYPTGAGLDTAFDIAFQAADGGLPVVSGLALGVDTAAHQGALCAGGYTLAVLGSGCDRLYPRSSLPVGRGILSAGGCILSEFPPGTAPLPYHFPRRNRIISGLSRGVVVVQAPGRSGALITADFALEQGREVFVCGRLLESPLNAGCRELAASGAPQIAGLKDITEEWGVTIPRNSMRRKNEVSTGEALAGSLEEELAGSLVRHRGKIYRRVYQHG